MTVHPSPPSGTTLRQRMIEDMTVRGFTEKTQHDYIRYVRTFAAFLGRSPDRATAEDLRRFQLHQTQAGLQPPGINSAVAALRFFFTVTLDVSSSGSSTARWTLRPASRSLSRLDWRIPTES